MAQHLKQLNFSKLLKPAQKPRRNAKPPSKSFLSIIPPWLVEKIEQEKQRDDRSQPEMPEQPPDEHEIVWPPPEEKKEKKDRWEEDRGVTILPQMKRK